ncbi:pentatricopeptide repeat-containing protein At3g23020 isoform X2 [Triticum aestivum]|uniref:pentatricopeptide repeat-containing protein At3g23020 isoform X2 n=1 Tax=Triticum aestivum TaxID=4565 RepID=UPI000844FD55|nr:pentatricopeptide repeat-containing protein At3g23020-like isoform X2 [Triticum aestivum]
MLSPCDRFLHRAPAPPPPPLNPQSGLAASMPGASRRDKGLALQSNAVSAPPARTAEACPNAAVVVPPTVAGTTGQSAAAQRGKGKGRLSGYGGSIPAMLYALERARDVGEALWPWRDTLSSRERTIILKEQKDWRRAIEIFDWFRGQRRHEVNVIHYNVVLCAVGRARRWDLVAGLWHQMHSCGVAPDNTTYGTLIDVYCKGGRETAALLWLGDMCKRGLVPDEVTMSTVLHAHKKAGEYEKAELFFQRWSSESDTGLDGHLCYSLYTYNTLIDTYGKAGQLEKVSDMFNQMLREGVAPSIITFNTLIHVWGKHHRMEQVASLVRMMEEFQCPPDTRTYNTLISLYRESNEIDVAEHYFCKMKAEKLVPDVVSCRTLLYGYCTRGMVSKAEALVKEMDESGLVIDEYTQSALTRMYVNAGMLEQSWCWFERFCNQMDSECFSANIDAFGKKGYINLAEKAFICCLERKMLSVSVCNVMIKAYGLAEKLDEACEIAAGMLSFTKHGNLHMVECLFREMVTLGVHADAYVYSILIDTYAEAGNVQQAAAYFGLVTKAGLCESASIYNSLIKLYTKAGYLAEAQKTYKLLKSLDTDTNLYASNCMIGLYSDHCMVNEARELFENLKITGSANEFSYAMMVCLYKKVARYDEAHRISKEMQALGLLTQALSYNSVIQMYVSGGKMEEAVKIFQKMMASSTPPNDVTFKALKPILVKEGVSNGEIAKLESLRRCNAQDCLNQWYRALALVVRSDGITSRHTMGHSCTRIHSFYIDSF